MPVFIQVKQNEVMSNNAYNTDSSKNVEWKKCDSASTLSNSNGDICRICHCEADIDNPLLSPCYCSGSLKYVHQSCLRQWLAASDTRSCELCKFNFILHTKIKPLSEWRILQLSSVERRRLLCGILFHFVAAICVIWSLFVLIDRAAEEVQRGLIAWPFWTKVVVVVVGFTGGAIFMFIQCRQYLHLISRWKAHNRIILVQNAPEKPSTPSPNFAYSSDYRQQVPPSQVVSTVDCGMASSNTTSRNEMPMCYVFENETEVKRKKNLERSRSSLQKADVHVEDLCDTPHRHSVEDCSVESNIIALDIECPSNTIKKYSLQNTPKTDIVKNKSCVFKSLPNLSTSSENLLL